MEHTSQTHLVAVGATPKHLPQYIAGISATMGAAAMGAVSGFASPASAELSTTNCSQITSNNTDWCLDITTEQNGWFVSTISLGALVGGPVAGLLLNIIGRRGTMLFSIMPYLLGWTLLGFAQNFFMLVSGQFVTGMCVGMMCLVVPVYIAEFSSADIRGTLGTGFQLMVNVGILFTYCMSAALHWRMLVIPCVVLPCIFVVLMFFAKESPLYLLSKGRDEQAKAALQYFRGPDYDISKEMEVMYQTVAITRENKVGIKDMLKPYIMKPLGIILSVMFFMQFAGINAVLFNLATIFRSTGSDLSDNVSSIIIAAVMTVSTFMASIFMDKVGRKILLIVSAGVMAVSHVALGVFFYELDKDKEFATEKLSWLPLVSLIVFITGFSIGYGPIPFILLGELFTPDIKELAGSIATAFVWIMSFVVTLIFPILQGAIHDYGVYWMFAVLCLVNMIFCILIVPETKGKTLEEISAYFGAPTTTKSSHSRF